LKSFLQSWRLFVLVWSLLLTPQAAFVHGLSHTLPQPASANGAAGDDRQHAKDKVCDSCLALAQLGAALPAKFDWAALSDARPEFETSVPQALALRHAFAFRARAPPAALI
jgi:hypothetical protein